ncbi:hypothetical protein LINGRAHAP2_LOCUS15204 [Linum grandiflorum]
MVFLRVFSRMIGPLWVRKLRRRCWISFTLDICRG